MIQAHILCSNEAQKTKSEPKFAFWNDVAPKRVLYRQSKYYAPADTVATNDLAALVADSYVALAAENAEFQAATAPSLPAGAFFARLSMKPCASF